MLDLLIVLGYFAVVLALAVFGGRGEAAATAEEFFLSGRRLRWPSIALSTIATNIQGYQFLGMMGSAYLYGLAQANLEINAVLALWLAAFVFVPLYLRRRVTTISQFVEARLGARAALVYSVANILLFATLGLGAALFWGAYAAEAVFADLLGPLGDTPTERIGWLIVGIGAFVATYTLYGGLSAVVRTDVVQFAVLTLGGAIVLVASLRAAGGYGALAERVPELMTLHLPADHPTLPWTAIGGMLLLNLNYWGANQAVLQRSLAARSLGDAQAGLLVGAVLKYAMAAIVVLPGIALAVVLGDGERIVDPDQAFPTLVTRFVAPGLRGVILCALFASLMSTADSLLNSIATLFTVDVYARHLRPAATDAEQLRVARLALVVSLAVGTAMAFVLMWVKFDRPEASFTHVLNELNYYLKAGIVVLIAGAVFLANPRGSWVTAGFFATIPLHLALIYGLPAVGLSPLNYFVRSGVVILLGFGLAWVGSGLRQNSSRGRGAFRAGLRRWGELFRPDSPTLRRAGWALLASLVLVHLVWH